MTTHDVGHSQSMVNRWLLRIEPVMASESFSSERRSSHDLRRIRWQIEEIAHLAGNFLLLAMSDNPVCQRRGNVANLKGHRSESAQCSVLSAQCAVTKTEDRRRILRTEH